MKRGDFLWGAAFICIVIFLVAPTTHEIFTAANKSSPYLMGFIKFAILASMGELLAIRIVTGGWKRPKGLKWRAVIWGFTGILITLMFPVFDAGVRAATQIGYLPVIEGGGFASKLLAAFSTSLLMNAFFGSSFMLFHRLTDSWIDTADGELSKMLKVNFSDVLKTADLEGFVSFVIRKTLPIFWVPAHTITFMLPPDYRVLMAAMLSICLGIILGFARKKRK